MRDRKLDTYHSGKLSELVTNSVKLFSVGGYDYAARLFWVIQKLSRIEFYLERLGVELKRPGILEKHCIDPNCYTPNELRVKIARMHWRDMHKLGDQVCDYLLNAENASTKVLLRSYNGVGT